MQNRKLILYIAMSLDGYIAGKDDDLSFLDPMMVEGEDYGYADFIKEVDAVILGKRTYDKVLSMGVAFPHTDKECYIITRTEKPSEGNLHFYTGDLKELVENLKKKEGKNIFCDGGAWVVNRLLDDQLIDEFYISVVPTILGQGIRLFESGIQQNDLELLSATEYSSGLVKLHYRNQGAKVQ